MTPFWHRLSLKQQRAVLNQSIAEQITYGQFMQRYRQPNWCMYPEAVAGQMGCWSLVFTDEKRISRERDCGDCECRKGNL